LIATAIKAHLNKTVTKCLVQTRIQTRLHRTNKRGVFPERERESVLRF
jgi:hypothetical protein